MAGKFNAGTVEPSCSLSGSLSEPTTTSEHKMTVRVRYFASLREKMGRIDDTLVYENIATVDDVWRAVSSGRPIPDQLLCAVNMEYAEPQSLVNDGDEVAFFPPVTGGSG